MFRSLPALQFSVACFIKLADAVQNAKPLFAIAAVELFQFCVVFVFHIEHAVLNEQDYLSGFF